MNFLTTIHKLKDDFAKEYIHRDFKNMDIITNEIIQQVQLFIDQQPRQKLYVKKLVITKKNMEEAYKKHDLNLFINQVDTACLLMELEWAPPPTEDEPLPSKVPTAVLEKKIQSWIIRAKEENNEDQAQTLRIVKKIREITNGYGSGDM